MQLRNDTRGQAIQIGALLLFAALIVAAAGYQAGIVPDQNSEIEFNHNQQVHGEMVELRNAMLVASDRQSTQTRRVTLGTRYPERTLFVNPPPASGTLRTSDRQEIRFENADSAGATTFSTRSIEYRPRYHEYRSAPTTVIEHGAVYNDHGTRVLPMTDTPLIENGEISLVLIDGELSLAGDRVRQVSVDAASPRSRTVPIQSADGDEFTLELPTRLSEEDWADTGALDGHDFEVTDGVLRVSLDGERSYDLTIARLGFGGDIEPAEPAYLTEVEGEDDVTIELRDEYNAPIEGETLTLSVADGDGTLDSGDATGTEIDLVTDREGQVSARYVPGDGETGIITVEASHESDSVDSVAIEFDVAGSTDTGSSQPGTGAVAWNEDDPTVVDADGEFSLEATNSRGDTLVNFAVSDRDVVQIVDAPDSFTDGTAEPTFEIDGDAASASGRDSWYAYVFDRSSGDRLTLQLPDTVGVVWETLEDWSDADEQDGVVHETFGDRQADAIQLGYEGTDDRLVGYWPLDEEDETVAEDVSGTGNDADHVDSPVIGADGLLETTSYEFDGESGHVEVPHDESLEMSDGDAVTVSTWVNQASDQSDEAWVALVQKSDTSYNLQLADGNEPTFTIHDGGWNEANSGIELEADRWYHLMGVYDGDEARIYVDGELEGTTTVDGEMTDASEFDVGIGENLDASGRHLDGRMDEVRLYDRALDTDEVEVLGEITEGSYTSGWKTSEEVLDLNHLRLEGVDADHNGGYISVTVEARQEDDTVLTSESIVLDGSSTYDVEGFDPETSAEEFRLNVVMTSPNIEQSPVLSRVKIVSEAELVVTEVDPDDPVDEGEELDVDISVENTGDVATTQDVALEVDSEQDGEFETVDDEEMTIDDGAEKTVTLTYGTETGDASNVNVRGITEDDPDGREVTVDVFSLGTGNIAIVETSEPTEAGDTMTVSVAIDSLIADSVELEVDGEADPVDSQPVGDEDELTLEWETTEDDDGDRTVTATLNRFFGFPSVSDSEDVTVLEPATFSVSLSDVDDPIAEGETGTVEADISNVGELSGSQTIELRYDENDDGTADETADTETVSDLEPEAETSVILEWEAEPEGETAIAVSSDDETTTDSVSVACNPEESDCEDTDGDVIVDGDDEVSAGDSDIDIGGDVSNDGEFSSEDGDIDIGGDVSNDGEFSSEDGDIDIGGDVSNDGEFSSEDGDIDIGGDVSNDGEFSSEDGDITVGGELTGTDESVLESEDGDVDISGGATLTESSELASEDGDVTIDDDVELIDSSLHTEDGDIKVDGDLTLEGDSEVSGGGDLEVAGDLTIVDTSEVTMDDGDVEVGGDLTVEDNGEISAEEIDVEGDDNR